MVHDVSLYDHCRSTAALSSALYSYHKETETLDIKSIQDDRTKKFLLISSNFYGIQNFIFGTAGELRGLRSKILRGRSFAVSLFSELAADMLCNKIGLPWLNVILNAAGKFTMLAANTDRAHQAVTKMEQIINDWLYDISFGESSMGFTKLSCSPADFTRGRFHLIWDSLSVKMDERKFHKLDLSQIGGAVLGYLDRFDNDLKPYQLCPLCGKRPSTKISRKDGFIGQDIYSCETCRDQVMLGTKIVSGKCLVILDDEKSGIKPSEGSLLKPIFGRYQLIFSNREKLKDFNNSRVRAVWNLNIISNGTIPLEVTTRLLNGYVPRFTKEDEEEDRLMAGKKGDFSILEKLDTVKEGHPKTFEHLANKALVYTGEKQKEIRGTEAIAVLKADIDNLGQLMACGLPPERQTVSRMATLSRQFNYFFTVYLPYILESRPEFQNTYTVFAGGDDLFLIGPWNRIIELSLFLNEEFAKYVCTNKKIHFSAGITLHKPHMPVDRIAEDAESALKTSKDNGRNRITLFNETVTWDEFSKFAEICNIIERWINSEIITKSLLYQLNEFIHMAKEEQLVVKKENIGLEDLNCLRWRSMLSYAVERNAAKNLKGDERQRVINEVMALGKWLQDYRGGMKIPLWQVLYNRR